METRLNDLEGLRMAMDIESRGQEFYTLAEKKFTDPAIKRLFHYLAAEEAIHLETFSSYFDELSAGKEAYETEYLFDEAYSGYLTALADTHVFPPKEEADKVLAAIQTPADALRLALQAEKDSVLFYGELAACSRFEAAKLIFRRLKDEERGHTLTLTRRLKELQ